MLARRVFVFIAPASAKRPASCNSRISAAVGVWRREVGKYGLAVFYISVSKPKESGWYVGARMATTPAGYSEDNAPVSSSIGARGKRVDGSLSAGRGCVRVRGVLLELGRRRDEDPHL
jgi:hypothetical protein